MTTASEPTAATARRPWYQSIAGNLLLAFALIVALTVSASLLSLIRFNQIDAVMNRLTGVSLPLVQSSLGVEAKTAELVVLATELSKAENEAQRFERMERLSDQIGQLWSVLSKLQTIISEETTAARLQQLVAAINTNIGDLDRSTRERSSPQGHRQNRGRQRGRPAAAIAGHGRHPVAHWREYRSRP